MLEFAAHSWPQRTAIVDEYGSISYLELYQQTELLKTHLLRSGLSHGMGLGVMGRNGRAFVAAMFAGLGCGAVVLPLSHQLKKAEIQHILIDTGIHAVIDDRTGIMPVENTNTPIKYSQQTLRFAWTTIARDKRITDLSDPAFIRYTSGTTGSSKGVVLSHSRIQERVNATQALLNFTPDDTVLWVLPMAFHFLVTILVYIRYGVQIIVCKDILAQTMINDANKYKATMIYGSPMHYRLLAADLSEKPIETLKVAISTSSGIPHNIAEAFRQRFKIPVVQAYGIIEIGLPLLDRLSADSDSRSVGFPAPGFSVSILTEEGEPAIVGETGKLAIRGPGMFNAYLKPWRTAEQVMKNGWFMTGDLAYRNEIGRIYICGREKTMINVSGNKVFPEEVETILNNHDDIIDSRVFAQKHVLMGEIVSAEVLIKDNVTLDVEKIIKFCRDRLSTYKVPQSIQPVKHILHTRSGKIKR